MTDEQGGVTGCDVRQSPLLPAQDAIGVDPR